MTSRKRTAENQITSNDEINTSSITNIDVIHTVDTDSRETCAGVIEKSDTSFSCVPEMSPKINGHESGCNHQDVVVGVVSGVEVRTGIESIEKDGQEKENNMPMKMKMKNENEGEREEEDNTLVNRRFATSLSVYFYLLCLFLYLVHVCERNFYFLCCINY